MKLSASIWPQDSPVSPYLFNYTNNTELGVQILKAFIMKFSVPTCHFFHGVRFSPLYLTLRHLFSAPPLELTPQRRLHIHK
jgi:hypothetical protein